MTDKNIPGLDQSWSQAEKMLDRHFMKRRIMILFFSFVIPAFIAGAYLMMNHSEKSLENNASVTTMTNPGDVAVPGTSVTSKSNPELQSSVVANESASNDIHASSNSVTHESVPASGLSTRSHQSNTVNENNYPADPGHSSSAVNSNSAAAVSAVDDQEVARWESPSQVRILSRVTSPD